MTPSLANTRADFIFTGRASHAAASPHLGRSALDAVELMNVGVNYMREHMPSDARVHYALLDAGGIAPNVVQAHARVRYSIRARDLPGMNELVERVHKIAQGAALMTETKVEMKIISAVSNLLPNTPLEAALHGIMEELGPPHFDDTDKDFAAKIRSTLTDKDIASVYYSIGMEPTDRPLADFIVPLDAKRNPQIGSTDVGDVSWVVPTVQVHAPTVAIGTPFHTWQVVAQGKSPHAHKAMVQAAKAMAGLGVRALTEPDLIAAAKADLNKRTARTPYVSPLPDSVAPPLDMSRGLTRLGLTDLAKFFAVQSAIRRAFAAPSPPDCRSDVRRSVVLPKQKSLARFHPPIVDSQTLTSGAFDVPSYRRTRTLPPGGARQQHQNQTGTTMLDTELRTMIDEVKDGRMDRRGFVQRMVAFGLTAPMATQMLAIGGVAMAREPVRLQADQARRRRRAEAAVVAGRRPCSTRISPSAPRTRTARASSTSRWPAGTPTATWCRSWRPRSRRARTAAWPPTASR